MTITILPFGELMKHMMGLRGRDEGDIAARLNLPVEVFPVLYRGLLSPNQELEQGIRKLLDWPKGSDDLLSIVVSSKYGDTPTIPTEEPEAEAPNPEPPSAPRITSEQADALKRKVGRPRSTRGFDDDRPINLGNLHGRVLG